MGAAMLRFVVMFLLCFVSMMQPDAYAGGGRTVLLFDTNGNITGSYVKGVGSAVERAQAQQAGVLEKKLISMGFEPSSAVANATVTGVSNVVTAVAGTATAIVVGATAPAWVSILAGAAVSAVVGTALQMAVGAAWKWLFNSDGSLTVSGGSNSSVSSANCAGSCPGVGALSWGGIKKGQPVYQTSPFPSENSYQVSYGSLANHRITIGSIAELGLVVQPYSCSPYPIGSISGCSMSASMDSGSATTATFYETNSYSDGRPNPTYTFATGLIAISQSVWSGNDCSTFAIDGTCASSSVSNGTMLLADAVAQSHSSDAAPVSSEATAALLNALWKQASQQSGYDGVPWNPANPVTSSDVDNWNSQNPSWVPDWADFTAPGGSSDAASSGGNPGTGGFNLPQPQISSPGTGSGTGTGSGGTTVTTGASGVTVNVTNNVNVSMCDNVTGDVAACHGLGDASGDNDSLFSSSFDASLKPFSVGGPAGQCPQPVSFVVFDHALEFSYEPVCSLASSLRPLVLALCALGAGFIVVMGIKS
ncbi:virulence factor TspB C-terminal domain-related protein [Burkholderia sp. 22313]